MDHTHHTDPFKISALKIPMLLMICFFVTGCSTMSKPSNPFSSVSRKPSQAVAVWSPAVLAGHRGFAGRLTFFGDDPKKGIKVEGDLLVYAFEERPDRSVSDNAPDKTYPIHADDLKMLETHSKKLGYSYSVWIPWDDDKPGEAMRQDVSLIVKLLPKNGMAVMSGQAQIMLPGKEPQFDDMLYAQQSGNIKQVSYEFGKRDRFSEELPPGYRDWTKKPRFGENWTTTPEERTIRSGNRPQRMSTTTIAITKSQQGNSSVAQSQNSQEPPGSFAAVAYNAEAPQHSGVNSVQYSQNAPYSQYDATGNQAFGNVGNPYMETTYGKNGPAPTDVQVSGSNQYGNPLIRQ